jgi:hypothetical protein
VIAEDRRAGQEPATPTQFDTHELRLAAFWAFAHGPVAMGSRARSLRESGSPGGHLRGGRGDDVLTGYGNI